MHRVARHRKALISYGARFNSTVAEGSTENKRRWSYITIPTRDEILKTKRNPSYTPDLSYLNKAPQDSLAGRLFEPKLQTNAEKKDLQEKRLAALAGVERAAKSSTPSSTTEKETPKEGPLDPAANIRVRAAERRARQEARKLNFDMAIRTVQDNAAILNSFHSLNSSGPLPFARSPKKRSAELPKPADLPDEALSPMALKRRVARRLRESRTHTEQFPMLSDENFLDLTDLDSIDLDSIDSDSIDPDSIDLEELEVASPTVQEPEFNGPEPIPKTLDDDLGFVQYHPFAIRYKPGTLAYRTDSLAGGDYSGHTSLSSSISNSTPPTALTVVNTAEQALSHQPDYKTRERKRAVEIVEAIAVAKITES